MRECQAILDPALTPGRLLSPVTLGTSCNSSCSFQNPTQRIQLIFDSS